MRRLIATGALAAALLGVPAPTLGHPGHGPVEIQVGDDFFQPAAQRVATGDSVVWKWSGPVGDHSVTADPGQAESFDSDAGTQPSAIDHPAGFTFTHRFTRVGRFTYACRVHPSMRGEIEVVALPPLDVVRPRVTKASVRPSPVCPRRTDGCRQTRAYLRLTLSERAVVVARIDQRARGRWQLVRTFDFEARKGAARRRLRVRGFEPGRYRLRLLAYDDADNSSPLRKVGFRIRKP